MVFRRKARSGAGKQADWRAPRLAGKTFCFTGRLGSRQAVTELIRAEGGSVAGAVTARLDYLVAGHTGTAGASGAEKKAQSLNQKGAAIQVIDEAALHQLLVPDRDTAIAMLRAGKGGIERWNAVCGQHWLQARVDLSGADFRKCDLSGADLEHADVDRCDFSHAVLDGVCIGRVSGARFDRSSGAIMLREAQSCSLQRCRIEPPLGWTRVLSNCDLTRAQVAGYWLQTRFDGCYLDKLDGREASFTGCRFATCTFQAANLAGATLVNCDLTAADLSGARLSGANLEAAALGRANLARADLRNARLINADLTGATIDGADLTGAQVAGVDLSTLDLSKAKGLQQAAAAVPVVTIGPNVLDLEQVAAKSQKIHAGIGLESAGGAYQASFQTWGHSQWVWTNLSTSDGTMTQAGHQQSVSAAMSDLAKRCPDARLKFNTVTVQASKAPLKGKALKDLCLAAWCEVFGQEIPTAEQLAELAQADKSGQQELREALVAELKAGAKGVSRWNKRPDHERRQASPFRNLDLAGLDLQSANFAGLDFQGTNFSGGQLKKANCSSTDLKKATLDKADAAGARFDGAKLNDASCREAAFKKCDLRGATLLRTSFQRAGLSGARLEYATLSGADFTSADLSGAKFDGTKFDESTVFPAGFTLPDGLIWAGQGKDPRVARKIAEVQQGGPVDFEAFMQRLEESFDASRLSKAVKMLKAERFQLFAQVEPDSVTGVVKSQTDPDLVYSCRLDSGGTFACCTQNLNPCGGLRGALCKHLLVLIVGLTRAGDLDPTTVHGWVLASRLQAPQLDKDLMSEVFLRYKGAEAGEIDWRPTETVPEDYYAF